VTIVVGIVVAAALDVEDATDVLLVVASDDDDTIDEALATNTTVLGAWQLAVHSECDGL